MRLIYRDPYRLKDPYTFFNCCSNRASLRVGPVWVPDSDAESFFFLWRSHGTDAAAIEWESALRVPNKHPLIKLTNESGFRTHFYVFKTYFYVFRTHFYGFRTHFYHLQTPTILSNTNESYTDYIYRLL